MSDPIKLLIIDDDNLFRESVAAFLEDLEFIVIEADNGEDGVRLFGEQTPDLVLCDTHMPGISGIEVLSAIHEKQEDVPFIIVSGINSIQVAVEALRLGAWDYIIKPIQDMGALELSINRALERSRLLQENARYTQEIQEDQEAAKVVQFQMLPQEEVQFGDYTLVHRMVPSLYLSGDFVDYFRLDDRHFVLYIADVSGHGAASAFITVLLKSFMNQLQATFSAGKNDMLLHPTEVMAKLSDEIREAKLGKYLTMIYGVIDMEDNRYDYCVGGHFPNPIISIPNEGAAFIKGEGFPVGVVPNPAYTLQNLALPDQFSLTMFSDGVLEILEETAIAEQENKLLEVLSGQHVTSESLYNALKLGTFESMPDDVTFLILSKN